MTADRKMLEALRERVRGAQGPDREIDGLLAKIAGEIPENATFEAVNTYGQEVDSWYTGGYGDYRFYEPKEYTASIDAAVALVARLRPDDHYLELSGPRRYQAPNYWRAKIVYRGGIGWGETTALAICDALLTVLLAESYADA